MFLKYKLGDKIVVKNDLIIGKAYGGLSFVEEMGPCLGQEMIINSINESSYCLKGSYYFWTEAMFEESFEELIFKPGDKVMVRSDLIQQVPFGNRFPASGMMQFKGQEVTIDMIYEGAYIIKESQIHYLWTQEMFDKLEDNMCKKKGNNGLSYNRAAAIEIIESLIETTDLEGESYFLVEDIIAGILDKVYPEGCEPA